MSYENGAFNGKVPLSWAEIIPRLGMIVLGLVLLVAPNMAQSIVFNLIGIACIVVGLVHVVRYARLGGMDLVSSNEMVTGLIFIVVGVLIIILKKQLKALLSIIIGVLILISGIQQLQCTLGFRRMHSSHWYIELICAAISVALGILVIVNPFTAMDLTMRVIGISLIIEGLIDLGTRAAYRKECNKNSIDMTSFFW